MAGTTQNRKRARLSRLDAIGLVMIVVMMVAVLYLIDQRGQQAANDPAAVFPAAIVNAASGTGDAPGRDLATVPRYPGSRRLFYSEQDNGSDKTFSVMYLSADQLNPVSAYYETEMPKHGWQLFHKMDTLMRMDFVRHDATGVVGVPEVTITFGGGANGGTTIAIIGSEPKSK